jgi:cobalt-zinc-cadmium efflux system outer membrane protein
MKRVLRWRAALIAAATALSYTTAFADTPPLTLDDALRIFRTSGFDLLIADATVASAGGDLEIARSISNPAVSLSRGNSFHYNPALCEGCSSMSISVGVTDQAALSDTLTGKRRLRVAVAQAALDVTRRSRADVERTLEFTLKQQLLSAELAKQSLVYATESQQLASDTLKLVNVRYSAGAVSEADVARAEVQKLETDQAVDAALQNLNSAKAALAYLLGYKETPSDLEVGDDLTHTGAAPLVNPSRDGLLEEALTHRPDLAATRFQVSRARSALALARRQRIPDFFPSAQYSQEGTGQSAIQPPTLTFGVSFSPPIFYRYRGEMEKAKADLRTQQVTAQKITAQVGSDVTTAVVAFTSARNRTTRMEGRLLERSARARDLVRLQYEKGAASLFEFLDAQRTFLSIRNEYLQNLNDYWSAVFQLEQATGMELHQ